MFVCRWRGQAGRGVSLAVTLGCNGGGREISFLGLGNK